MDKICIALMPRWDDQRPKVRSSFPTARKGYAAFTDLLEKRALRSARHHEAVIDRRRDSSRLRGLVKAHRRL